eukprot:COSAG02_NODE_1096_length_14601_cov_185.142946_10_plen_236_part_00
MHTAQRFLLKLGHVTEKRTETSGCVAKLVRLWERVSGKATERSELMQKRKRVADLRMRKQRSKVSTIKIEGDASTLDILQEQICRHAIIEACWQIVDNTDITRVELPQVAPSRRPSASSGVDQQAGSIVARIFCVSHNTKVTLDQATDQGKLLVNFQDKVRTAALVRYHKGRMLSQVAQLQLAAIKLQSQDSKEPDSSQKDDSVMRDDGSKPATVAADDTIAPPELEASADAARP